VRVLCPHCKTEDKSDIASLLKQRLDYPQSQIFYKGVGCGECRQTGFHGRQAIFEWMDMNNEIIQLLLKNSSAGEIRVAAVKNGMKSLSDDGWRLVRRGITTPEEVMRVTKDQTMFGGDKKSLVVENPEIPVVAEVENKPKMVVGKR
jgi:type II secretory ATPase GspE/PulE/Tfp pilus assembly ATPase PilB-like protein